MVPHKNSSIILQILSAGLLCAWRAMWGALILLFISIILVLSWYVDLFSYFVALVYLGGVLVLILYFTSFVSGRTSRRFIFVLIVAIRRCALSCWQLNRDVNLGEFYASSIEILLVVIVYLLWLLRYIRQSWMTLRI